jgi:hypothetical protein
VKQEALPTSSKGIFPMRNDLMKQPVGRDGRDDFQGRRDESSDVREGQTDGGKGKSKAANKKGGGSRFAYPNNMTARVPQYPMYGHPSYASFMGSSYGPPPPHYPPPHMSMPPYTGVPYPGHPGAQQMKGLSYPPHPHYHGPNFGMPPAYPHQQGSLPSSYPIVGSSSDSTSISSKNSLNSKKKRTIDGVHHIGQQLAYGSFRQTDSGSTATSSLTTGNNMAMETSQNDDSQQKREQSGSNLSVLNMDGMEFSDSCHQGSFHRHTYSAASTASSLSVCGFSLTSFEGQRGKSGSLCVDLNVYHLRTFLINFDFFLRRSNRWSKAAQKASKEE